MEPLERTVNLLHETVVEATTLANLHLELIRSEAKRTLEITRRLATLGFLLILGLIPTAVMLSLALSHFISETTEVKGWQSELLVGGLCLTACAILAWAAYRQLLELQDK